MVPRAGGAVTLHSLLEPDRLVGSRLHHVRAVHIPTSLPRKQRDRPDIQDLLRPRHPRQGENLRRDQGSAPK